MPKLNFVPVILALLAVAPRVAADPEYASPPNPFPGQDGPGPEPEPYYQMADQPSSTVRAGIGPALLLSERGTEGGFAAQLDVGARAAGVRFAGAWLNVGGDHGLSQYTAELWIDFGAGRRLHPILAAGAGLARLEHAGPDGSRARATVGVGTLRGSLEYELPIEQADARAGLDLSGAVPAIRAADSSAPGDPWLLAVARVGVGF